MNTFRKTAYREPKSNLLSERRTSGSTIHPELRSKIERRIRDGYYDSSDVIKELADRILKFCITK